MMVIGGIIKTALEITGIFLGPLNGDLIIEFDMRLVCHFKREDLYNAFVNRIPLYPQIEGPQKNILISDATEYLHWNFNPIICKIAAVKKGEAQLIDLKGNIVERVALLSPFDVDKIYLDDELSSFVCIHSKPINIDFYETGVGIYHKKDKTYQPSNKIHSSELEVTAFWNSNSSGWILYDNYNKKIFWLGKNQNEVIDIDLPSFLTKGEIDYFINETATFVTAVVKDDYEIISEIWIGEIIKKGKISWQRLKIIEKSLNAPVAINPLGTKIGAFRKVGSLITLCILDRSNGEIIEEKPVEENYKGVGLGWISEKEIVSVGSKGLLLLSSNNKKSLSKGLEGKKK